MLKSAPSDQCKKHLHALESSNALRTLPGRGSPFRTPRRPVASASLQLFASGEVSTYVESASTHKLTDFMVPPAAADSIFKKKSFSNGILLACCQVAAQAFAKIQLLH